MSEEQPKWTDELITQCLEQWGNEKPEMKWNTVTRKWYEVQDDRSGKAAA